MMSLTRKVLISLFIVAQFCDAMPLSRASRPDAATTQRLLDGYETNTECTEMVTSYEPPASFASCPDEETIWAWDECVPTCRGAFERIGHDLGCCFPEWIEELDSQVEVGQGEAALHYLMHVCGVHPLHDPLIGCPGQGGACPACDEIMYILGEEGVEIAGPVCGLDNVTYENECGATFCGDTSVACHHECPCDEPHDAEGCTDVDLPHIGHHGGPMEAYEVIYNVTWPEECCDLCEEDSMCNGFTWTDTVFSGLSGLSDTADCYLFADPSTGYNYHPFCYSGNKYPDNFYSDDTLSQYWQRMIGREGDDDLDVARLGYSTDDHTWYYDGVATCIGWGYFDHECDSERLVCAGGDGDTYGFGTEQVALLNEFLENLVHGHSPHSRHFMCPVCVDTPWDDDYMYVCDRADHMIEMPKYIVAMEPSTYLIPGEMAPYPMGTFVDCFCGFHHAGESIDEYDTYWRSIARRNDLDDELLTYYEGVWFYSEEFTCVGMGDSGDACDNTMVYCAGGDGDHFGSAEQQMNAIHDAVDNGGRHPECPYED